MMIRSFFTIALASLLLTGCPKGGGGGGGAGKNVKDLEEDEAKRPGPNFKNGLEVLKDPGSDGSIDYLRAYGYFDKAATLGGGAKAHFNAGWTAERAGRFTDAAKHYKAAFDADPTYEAAMFSLAQVSIQADDPNTAVTIYKGYLAEHPDNADVRNELVAALVKAKMYQEATTEAQTALQNNPKNDQVFRSLSAMYYDQQNIGMSQLTAEQALSVNDGDPGTYNNMGVNYLAQGDEAAAIDKFKTAIQLDSGNYEANMNLGWIALNSGDYQLADTTFTPALKARPGSMQAKQGLAIAKRGMQDYKAANQLYVELLDVDPNNQDIVFNAVALNEVYVKDYKKALGLLQTYIDANAVGPNHEVFTVKRRVEEAKAAEDEVKRLEAEAKKAEEERRKRNAEILAGLGTTTSAMQTKLDSNRNCVEEGYAEELAMMIEQANEVVSMEDVDMAADVKGILDGYVVGLDDAVANCASGAPAPEDGAMEDAPEDGAMEDEAAPE